MWPRLLGAVLAALVLLAVSPVLAADKGGATFLDPPKAVDDNGWNRSSAYVGAIAGYNTAVIDATAGFGGIDLGNAQLMAGVMAGYNWRAAPRLVLGVEADFVYTDVKGAVAGGGFSLAASNDYLATIRGRAGIPFGPALLYATAGVAFTDQAVASTAGGASASDTETLVGAAVGLGIEAELTQALFVRVEGLHYMFPDQTVMVGGAPVKAESEQTAVRLGVGFKLN